MKQTAVCDDTSTLHDVIFDGIQPRHLKIDPTNVLVVFHRSLLLAHFLATTHTQVPIGQNQ